MRYLSTLLLLIISIALIAQSTIESIPNQKLINGSYVSNPNKILDDGTVHQLDTLLGSLEKKTTAQVAVVNEFKLVEMPAVPRMDFAIKSLLEVLIKHFYL